MSSLPSLTSLPLANQGLHHHTTFEDLPPEIIRQIHLDARPNTGLEKSYPSIEAGVFYIWKKRKRRLTDEVIRCRFILKLKKIPDIKVKETIEKIFKLERTHSKSVFHLYFVDFSIPFSERDTFEKVVEVYTNKAKDAMLDVVQSIYEETNAYKDGYFPRLYVTPNELQKFYYSFVFQGGMYNLRSGLQGTNKKIRNATTVQVAEDALLAEKHDDPLKDFIAEFFAKPSNFTFSSHQKSGYS